jgi:hypothetical protein
MNQHVRDALARPEQKLAAKPARTPDFPSKSKITKQFSGWLSC